MSARPRIKLQVNVLTRESNMIQNIVGKLKLGIDLIYLSESCSLYRYRQWQAGDDGPLEGAILQRVQSIGRVRLSVLQMHK